MTKSIPAKFFVSIIPAVLGVGGSGIDINALTLSASNRSPIGAIQTFPTKETVASYYGGSSPEASAAAIYFAGFDDSTIKPGAMLFVQYNAAAASGWVRGGSLAALSLVALKALNGILTVTVDGVSKTSATINLSAATSFSNAATLIQAGFTTPGFAVTFDSIAAAFLFTSATSGSASSMSFLTGSLAHPLSLLLTDGAVLSAGADAAAPGTFMDGVTAATQNFVTIFSLFDPDGGNGNAVKLAFSAWVTAQDNRYCYLAWDTDLSPTVTVPATTSMGAVIGAANTSGTCLIITPSSDKAAFIAGAAASVDYTETDGRANFAYRSQAGLSADVTDALVLSNLMANGYNCYLAEGDASLDANANSNFFYPGSVSGEFAWLDSYLNQIQLNNGLQASLISLLKTVKSVPYNPKGYALIQQAVAGNIAAALNFGTIRPGVVLSTLQAAEVNAAAGAKIDTILSSQGWYLQVKDPGATARLARTTPNCTFWYMDGGSVNTITLSSVLVQ